MGGGNHLLFHFAHFKLGFNNFTCIVDTSPLLHMWIANILPQSVACLLILFTGSFTEQTFLTSIKSSLSIFLFADHVFDVISKNTLPSPRSQRFYVISESFIVLCFTLMSMTHVELIFVWGIRFGSRFLFWFGFGFWTVDVQLLQNHLLKRFIHFFKMQNIWAHIKAYG